MKNFFKLFFTAIFITFVIFIFLIFYVQLPEKETPIASTVFDINGNVIEHLYQEKRLKVPIENLPTYVSDSFISIEDRRFYKHFGIDPISIIRATYINLKNREIVEGGSTITQQVSKNLFLTHERTFSRKIQDILFSLKLEIYYSKEEILETYLNQIYFGHGKYGIEAASNHYFGKSAENLSFAESAMLAGLPRRPEYYSPINNFKASKSRQELVIDRMYELGYISLEDAIKAKEQEIEIIDLAEKKKHHISPNI